MLPLYEAKMIHHYDSRWATYEPDGSTRDVTADEKADPAFVPMPRYWVSEVEVKARLAGRWHKNWLLGYRWVARSTDERTVISTAFTAAGVGNSLPLIQSERAWLLQSCLSSVVADFTARQKLGGANLTFGTMQQLAVLPPVAYVARTPWQPSLGLSDWVTRRVLELSFTAWEIQPFAQDLGYNGPPFRWDLGRRAVLRAELDAAYFHLYGLDRDEVDHVLSTFPILRRKDETAYGEFRTRRLILEIYDAMQLAMRGGPAWQSSLNPHPGNGPQHVDRKEALA